MHFMIIFQQNGILSLFVTIPLILISHISHVKRKTFYPQGLF